MSDFYPLSKASRFFPGNPHENSVRRWAAKGLNGVKLRTMKFGGKRLTCQEWCLEFQHAVSEGETAQHPHIQAEAHLDRLGV